MIQFKKETKTAMIPERKTDGAAGFDLYADEPGIVAFGTVTTISTGISMAIPPGYVGLIKPRSGLAVKHGIETGAGVIDSDFRAAVSVVLTSVKSGPGRMIHPGDRIAQIVFVPIMTDFVEVTTLGDTERGANGFGSTGEN